MIMSKNTVSVLHFVLWTLAVGPLCCSVCPPPVSSPLLKTHSSPKGGRMTHLLTLCVCVWQHLHTLLLRLFQQQLFPLA